MTDATMRLVPVLVLVTGCASATPPPSSPGASHRVPRMCVPAQRPGRPRCERRHPPHFPAGLVQEEGHQAERRTVRYLAKLDIRQMIPTSAADQRFVLPVDVQIRVRAQDQVEVRRHRHAALVSPDQLHVLMQFAEPRRIADVQRPVDVTEDTLTRFVKRLCDAGILIEAPSADVVDLGLRSLLRPDVLGGTSSATELQGHLKAGRLVIIPNAFREDFAGAVYQSLESCTRWDAYEGFPVPSSTATPRGTPARFFHFKHHNLYDFGAYPPALRECLRVFSTASTREFIGELSGRDCKGRIQFSASLYLPGDYSLPHSDAAAPREVAFIWHLTKSWHPEWGGALFWCPTATYVSPSYNSLILFNVVEQHSYHFVTPVSPYAQGKRLTVNGWWTSDGSAPPERPRDTAEMSAAGGVCLSRQPPPIARESLPSDVIVI